jgi:PKD repeat protein
VSEGCLFGNNTVFILYGFYVRVKGDLTIVGQWFNPGTIMILWDDTTLMGVTAADGNGFFETTVTVPITSEGNHSIIIKDTTVKFVLNVQCLSVLDLVPPVADAGPNLTVNEDTTFTFNGSGSKDNKGIISYIWTFIDTLPKTLHGVNPEYVFSNPGVYHVTLNVTDVGGNWDTDELVVTVLDITMPIAEAGPDQIVNEDTWVTLNGSHSTDNKGVTLYVWTIVGDTVWTLTGAIVEHNFTNPGIYMVTLNITDAAGNWGADRLTVTILDVTRPVAEAGSNQTIVEGGTVNLNAYYSSDNVGIVVYEWDFGDGTNGSGLVVNHTYDYPWNYTVSLTVIDQAGNNDTDYTIITVLRNTDRDSIPDIFDNDDDGDGMPDAWEEKFGLNTLSSADASIDNDGDGLINLREFLDSTDPNDFFSPLKLWVIAVTLVPFIVVAIAAYFMARTTKVSKQEYVETEIAKFIEQFPDVKQLNPGYFNWKVAEIRQEAEKQFDELTKTGYTVVTRTPIRKRLNKALKKNPEKAN